MSTTTESRLASIEKRIADTQRMLKLLLDEKHPDWVSETEAMKIMNRSSSWLRIERLGVGKRNATLIMGTDWRYINGRTPEYRRTSLEARKAITNPEPVN